MKINWRLLDWNLRHKIVLHILVIGVLTTVVLGYLYIKTQNNIISTINLQKVETIAVMIDCNVTHDMEDGRAARVGPALVRIIETSNISRIRILNTQGEILNSSDPVEIGDKVEQNQRRIISDFYSDLENESIFDTKPVTSTLSYKAIQNKPECYGCHSQTQKINGIAQILLDESPTVRFARKNYIQGAIIALVALLVLIVVILRLFEKIINRPLSELKSQMKKIQEGDLDIQLEPKKKDEIGDLTLSFNTMVQRLRDANHKIEELHNQQIEKAGHLASLGELAAGLAHEIKNPVAGIKGSLEIITTRTDPEDPNREIFVEIIKQTQKIYNIIQDLLNYAKPKELVMSPVNPNRCLQETINLAKTQTQDKEIEFKFLGLEEEIEVTCDKDKMQEVFLNLMINGIAAIEKKGEIKIHIQPKAEESLEISVSDNGRGIKSEHIGQIFTPFFTTRKQGTGLGLSICKQIIEAHNGTIRVSSEEGKGTIFTVWLPKQIIT